MPKTNTRRHRRRRQKIQYGAGAFGDFFDSLKQKWFNSGVAETGTALVDQAKAKLVEANNKVNEGNAKLAANASGWWESLKNKFSFGSNNNNNEQQTGGINASRTKRRRRQHRGNH